MLQGEILIAQCFLEKEFWKAKYLMCFSILQLFTSKLPK